MIRRPPRSTQGVSSAASDVYKRQPLAQALQGVDRAAMASHLSLVTLGLVGYDLIQSEDYSFRRLATLAIAIACWLCHAGEVKKAALKAATAVLDVPETPLPVRREPPRRMRTMLEDVPRWTVPREEAEPTPNTWRHSPADTFQLRGGSYLRDRVKIKSSKATYEVVDVRVLRSPEAVSYTHLTLPTILLV